MIRSLSRLRARRITRSDWTACVVPNLSAVVFVSRWSDNLNLHERENLRGRTIIKTINHSSSQSAEDCACARSHGKSISDEVNAKRQEPTPNTSTTDARGCGVRVEKI